MNSLHWKISECVKTFTLLNTYYDVIIFNNSFKSGRGEFNLQWKSNEIIDYCSKVQGYMHKRYDTLIFLL